MKKTLLTIFAGVLMAGSASAQSQCTPDPAYATASGNFFPDSVTFLAESSAMAGVDYESVINIKTISDTVVSANVAGQTLNVNAVIDAFKVYSVEGAPAGFSFTGGGTTYEQPDPTDLGDAADSTWWNNYGTPNDASTVTPVQGCLQITAAAADVSNAAPATGFTDYPVTVLVDARIVENDLAIPGILNRGDWLSDLPASLAAPLPVTDYVIRVAAANSVFDVLNPNVFEVHQSYPNPAGNEAIITFTNPGIEEVEFKVFNMLGALVHSQNILSERGVNNIELNTGRMSAGMYIYTVSKGDKVFTKKMTVK